MIECLKDSSKLLMEKHKRAKNTFFPRKETKFSRERKTAPANANCNDSGFVPCYYSLSVNFGF